MKQQIDFPFEQLLRIQFPVLGRTVAVDHHQALYAALSRLQPDLHELDGLSFSPIVGGVADGKWMNLDRRSKLYIQVPTMYLGKVIGLAGKKITLMDDTIRLGIPQLRPMIPSKILISRFVTVKNAVTEEGIRDKVKEQLEALEIETDHVTVDVLRRRVIEIHGQRIVGWGMRLEGLSEKASLLVQMKGIGGRRRYGSGFFLPVREGRS